MVGEPWVAVVKSVDRHYAIFSRLYVRADSHLLFSCVAAANSKVMAVLRQHGHYSVVAVQGQSRLYCRRCAHVVLYGCRHGERRECLPRGCALKESCAGCDALDDSLRAICVRGSCRSPCVYDHLLPQVEAVLHVRVEVVESEESVTISVPSPVDMVFPVGISVDNKRVSAICCRLSEVQHRIALLQLLVYHIHPLFVGV